MLVTLVAVSAVSGLLIALVFQWTLPLIQANRAAALREAVFQVIPGAGRVETFRLDPQGTLGRQEDSTTRTARLFAGYGADGALVGVAIEAQGQGYQDVIKLIYGYDPQRQVIVGMKVLDAKETPGLGEKIGKDPGFLANFDALDVHLNDAGDGLRNPLAVVKGGKRGHPWQIDAITGATISSNAVGRILNTSAQSWLPIVQRNLSRLASPEAR